MRNARLLVEALRALTWSAVEQYVAGRDVTRLASMAKLKCGRLVQALAAQGRVAVEGQGALAAQSVAGIQMGQGQVATGAQQIAPQGAAAQQTAGGK
jgi:citronellyl-CoA dehydrogenase